MSHREYQPQQIKLPFLSSERERERGGGEEIEEERETTTDCDNMPRIRNGDI